MDWEIGNSWSSDPGFGGFHDVKAVLLWGFSFVLETGTCDSFWQFF